MQYCLYGEVEKGQDQRVKMGVRTKVDQMSNLDLGHYSKGVAPLDAGATGVETPVVHTWGQPPLSCPS